MSIKSSSASSLSSGSSVIKRAVGSSLPSISGSFNSVVSKEKTGARDGMGWPLTSFFLIAQMAGAGFLSLPMALNNTGWLGVPMMIIFCVAVGYSGTRLGVCWVILEERWPEDYGVPVRQPYMEIADRALGKHGRRTALWCVLLTVIGGSTVYVILVSQLTSAIAGDGLSVCEWVIIYGICLLPFTWLGTPKDFWQASIIAVAATVIACLVVFVELFVDHVDDPMIQHPNPTFKTFSLGFGAILFAFGGASTFPTIQNDMRDRSDFWKSVVVAFMGILTLYLPVAVAGYSLLGNTVGSNILLSVGDSTVVVVAIVTEVLNLLGTYLITFNPISQTFEEMLNIPGSFGPKRIALRSSVVVVEILICLAIPDFGLILNLIGGSTVTLCSFILPPLMYMRLVDSCTDPKWPKRTIPTWERIVLWEIIIVGTIGGISSTVSSLIAILDPDSFGASCFADFTP